MPSTEANEFDPIGKSCNLSLRIRLAAMCLLDVGLFKGSTRGSLREDTGPPLMGLCNFMTHQEEVLKTFNSIKISPLWAWQNLYGYGGMISTKFWLWGMAWDLSYDHSASHVATQSANPY